MHSSFDQTSPLQSRWDQDGSEYVRSNIDWCARFAKRLVALSPGLGFEDAMNLSQRLGLDNDMRAKSPESVAEDLSDVDLIAED